MKDMNKTFDKLVLNDGDLDTISGGTYGFDTLFDNLCQKAADCIKGIFGKKDKK